MFPNCLTSWQWEGQWQGRQWNLVGWDLWLLIALGLLSDLASPTVASLGQSTTAGSYGGVAGSVWVWLATCNQGALFDFVKEADQSCVGTCFGYMLALHRPHNCHQAIMNVAGAPQHMNAFTAAVADMVGVHFHSGAAGMPNDSRRWRSLLTISWRLPVRLLDRNTSLQEAAERRVANRSFAVPDIEQCPARTVWIFLRSSRGIIAAGCRCLSRDASRKGLRWF